MLSLAAAVIAACLAALAIVAGACRTLRREKSKLTADFMLLQRHNDRLTEQARDRQHRLGDRDLEPPDHLAAVTEPEVGILRQAILNAGERHVLAACDDFVATRAPPGWRVFAQVSLGEVLTATGRDIVLRGRAFRAFNSKRCDIVIVDASGLAVAAVEYQGAGHDQGDARDRDAVKRAACQRAGIAFIEIADAASTAAIIAALEQHLAARLALSDRVL